MSPRDALKRITSSFSQAQPAERLNFSDRSAAQDRLAAIMAEVSAIQVEDFVPSIRTQPRRNVAEAPRWFMLSDAVALIVSFILAWSLAAAANAIFFDRELPLMLDGGDGLRFLQFALVTSGVLVWFSHLGHYRNRMPFWLETQQIAKALSFAMLMDGFMIFASKQDFSRLWLMSGWVFAGFMILAMRVFTRRVLRRRGLWQVRTLLVGGGVVADEARAALRSEPGLGYEVVMQIDNLPLLLDQVGNSWERLCDRFSADYVVIALDGKALAECETQIQKLVREGLPFSVSPPLRHLPVLGMSPQYFFNHDVMLMTPSSNLELPLPRLLKRSLDVFGAGMGLLVLSPVLLILSLIVKLDGGPAFFGHKRVGMSGKSFYCLKFRSMVLDSEKALAEHLEKNPQARREWAETQKLQNDPRVTRVGRVMRKWSLDELPQLINVLRGDMSLVGPRPVVRAETARYNDEIAMYYRVRPGLTGLWQVSGRSDVSFHRRVQMDCWYVRNWSLWHDIAILFKTIPVILKKTGAY